MDATDLPPNHEISESGAVLHLYNVQYEDVGAYECEAINTKGKDWHKAWLYVECKWAHLSKYSTNIYTNKYRDKGYYFLQ